jgi:hypothetical protein
MLSFLHNGSGSCIEVEQAGSGVGVVSIQSGSSAAGLFTQNGGGTNCAFFVGGTTACITAQGDGTGCGGLFQSGTTAGANGVEISMANTSGFGLYSNTGGAALAAARAVRALATGDGIGIEATGVDSAGGRFSASGAAGVAIYCPGKASDPTNVFDGRLDWNTTTRSFVVSDQNDIAYRDVWTSRGGAVLGAATGGTGNTAGTVVWVTVATLALTGSNAPKRASTTITLRAAFTPRQTVGGSANTISFQIYDATAVANVLTRSGTGTGAGAGVYFVDTSTNWQPTVYVEVQYTIPVAGNRTFELQVRATSANGWAVRDASLVPFGAFV